MVEDLQLELGKEKISDRDNKLRNQKDRLVVCGDMCIGMYVDMCVDIRCTQTLCCVLTCAYT